jgi:nucleotide-binding universal stress UspA family protein
MKTIRSILLQLDATPASARRLEFARHLAQRTEAVLSAMFVVTPPQPSFQMAFAESPAALMQGIDGAEVDRVHAAFDAATRDRVTTRWLEGNWADPIRGFCDQALYADLLLLGQREPDAADAGKAPAGFVESVLLLTGKPALILPFTGEFESIGQNVLIGWNASPQAARAVAGAMPWLRSARRVHVLETADERAGPVDDSLDLTQYLALHGIAATTHHAGAVDPGNSLLSLACDVDADLLVMGCYGHSRAREFVLGGATRMVLQTMTLPVLMAH